MCFLICIYIYMYKGPPKKTQWFPCCFPLKPTTKEVSLQNQPLALVFQLPRLGSAIKGGGNTAGPGAAGGRLARVHGEARPARGGMEGTLVS